MAHAYTPGLKVTSRMRYSAQRVLPLHGEVRVALGDRVDAQQVIAEAFMPGDITPLNLSNLLAVSPSDLPECMLVAEGEKVEAGQPIATTKGIFGLFKSEHKAPVGGTIESVSEVTGQVILRGEPLPVQLKAYLAGEVKEILPGEGAVIEADATFIQGIFGIGGEAYGPIHIACPDPKLELTEDLITAGMKGAVVVGGGRVTDAALEKAIQIGVAAVITGGIDDQDLKDFLGYDLGVAITGSEKIGLTLIITEGFGDISMAERTWQLLDSRKGDLAAVNGATQIRAGVMRPEVVIPLSEKVSADQAEHTAGLLDIDMPVRLIRDPYFGLIGTVSDLPSQPHTLASGSKARVLEVTFASGEKVIVPRANVELIEQ